MTNPDWLEIPPVGFSIQGLDGSSLQFVARAVLGESMERAVAIHFDLTLKLPALGDDFCIHGVCADYGRLQPFRHHLGALLAGQQSSASFSSGGVAVTVGLQRCGVREAIFVHGYLTSLSQRQRMPWPSEQRLAEYLLLEEQNIGTVQFAFQTACIDPPLLEETIAQIDELLRRLQ